MGVTFLSSKNLSRPALQASSPLELQSKPSRHQTVFVAYRSSRPHWSFPRLLHPHSVLPHQLEADGLNLWIGKIDVEDVPEVE